MINYSLKTYTSKTKLEGDYFFILSKGNNAGKPLRDACPNCFIMSFKDDRECEMFYQLCFVLWKTRRFETWLRGSVIPFITIGEFHKVLLNTYYSIDNKKRISNVFNQARKIEDYQESLIKKIDVIKEYRLALLSSLINKKVLV